MSVLDVALQLKTRLSVSLRTAEYHRAASCGIPALKATARPAQQLENRRGANGIHCPNSTIDLSTEGLLRGAPAPKNRCAG